MIAHPRRYAALISEDTEARVLDAAYRILEHTGIEIASRDMAREIAACRPDLRLEAGRLRMPRETAEELVALAPAVFTVRGRRQDRTVTFGDHTLLISPGYGSSFISDRGGSRRPATLADYRRLLAVSSAAEAIDVTGGLLVEPQDVAPAQRSVALMREILTRSDKPFFGSVAGKTGSRQAVEMAEIAFPSLSPPVMLGLINIRSPLCLDEPMAEAMLCYVTAGQPIVLTPGILMGMSAPVTLTGALSQAFAELVGCLACVQALRPSHPVVVGLGGFGADLRRGGPGFGRPENALAAMIGAQISRHLGVPFRCSGAVTGAFSPDIRSGYESMLTAMAAWQGGSSICMQGAGTLDSINAMSYEKLAADLEVWAYIKRLASVEMDDSDVVALVDRDRHDFLSSEHTVARFRRELLEPRLAPAWSYDEWSAAGFPQTLDAAEELARQLAGSEGGVAELDAAARRELDRYARLAGLHSP